MDNHRIHGQHGKVLERVESGIVLELAELRGMVG